MIPRDKFGIIHSRQWFSEESRRDMFGVHLNASGECTCEWRCCVNGALCICTECQGCERDV